MPDPKVTWRKYKKFSGPRILGSSPMSVPTTDRHVDRAYWLTAKVESGAKFGAIVMYDGTALTGGPDQHIAVYPKHLADDNAKDDQGGLWKLLRRLEYTNGGHVEHMEVLWGMLREHGWYISQDGALRYLEDNDKIPLLGGYTNARAGELVFGDHIRRVLTPCGVGVVPRHNYPSEAVHGGATPKKGWAWSGAREWALAFHRVLAHPDTHRAQVQFGREHLVERTHKRRIKYMGKWHPLSDVGYGDREVTAIRVGNDCWSEERDLALAIYQSHSVNAPGKANRILGQARKGRVDRFPQRLIKLLGTSSYGRWDDDLKTGRYQRTRSAARASGLWPKSLFDGPKAIMPKDLPG